jgi:hypothetical protein
MVAPKVRDLIQRDVDGLLSAQEAKTLASLLKRAGEAKRLHKDLTGLSASLMSLGSVAPPAHLATRIKAAVRTAYPADFAVASLPVRSSGRTGPWIRSVALFGAGFALGVVALLIIGRPEAANEVTATTASGSLVDQHEVVPIRFGGTEGNVTVARRDGETELSVRVTVPEGTVLRVDYNSTLVTVVGLHGPSGKSGILTVRDGRVETSGKGVQEFSVVVSPRATGAALAVSLVTGDREVFRKAIPIGG